MTVINHKRASKDVSIVSTTRVKQIISSTLQDLSFKTGVGNWWPSGDVFPARQKKK